MNSNSATAITPFPQTPVTPNENQARQSVSESLSTTTRARAIMKLGVYYREVFGTAACPPVAQREISYFLGRGMEEDVICEAMDEASLAPRPSWRYARAVLDRCLSEGVKTVDAYYERRARWENGRR